MAGLRTLALTRLLIGINKGEVPRAEESFNTPLY